MSDHAVEDFIENCVRLVVAADVSADEKRRLFYHLYRLQNHFDCSHTVLRCFPELAQHGFIRKLPLTQHPDFHRHPDYFAARSGSEWLAADVGHPADEAVFSLSEQGKRWIFPQFGSRLWARLCSDGLIDDGCETPTEMTLPDLILRIVQLGHAAHNDTLMKEAYLLFVECWLEHIAWDETPLPRRFDDWRNHPTLTELREWAVEHNLLTIRRQDSALRRYSLSEELDNADTPDAEALTRLVLDLKKTPEAIAAKLAKARITQQKAAENLVKTADFLEAQMSAAGWQPVSAAPDTEEKYYNWLWYRDNAEQQRILLTLSLDRRYKYLTARFYMQHPLLLQWQQRSLSTDSADFHFKADIGSLLPNRDNLPMGDWRYDLGTSWPLLQNKLRDSVAADIHTALPLFETRIHRYFPQDFFSRSAEDYITLFDEMDAAPDFLIIHSLENILLVLIAQTMQSGDRVQAQRLAELFQQRYPQLQRSSRQPQIQPFLEAALQGRGAPLPPFGTGFYFKL
ncbi:MAG: hypothetical protein Q4G28_04055 [Neisseria sp.]|nr:hypothetical protein [Neisseria sp.]